MRLARGVGGAHLGLQLLSVLCDLLFHLLVEPPHLVVVVRVAPRQGGRQGLGSLELELIPLP